VTVRRADIHQHLWPDGLLSSLPRRTVAPRLRRDGRGWLLELAGDAPAPFDPRDHDLGVRAELARADGLDRVVVALSHPLGLEALPDAENLLDEFHRGVLEAGAPFELWGSVALGEGWAGLPSRVESLLDAGAVGLSLPAGALSGPAGIERLGPALEALGGRPLFIHPGPAAGSPAWFPALTAYVAEMSAAWHAWAQWGRPAHPRLKVVFAMLAGGAPLHAERLDARGGPAEAVHDELTFFDVSSYGPRTVDAMLRVVGVDRLVYGSDAPVIEPVSLEPLGESVMRALSETNPARLLSLDPVPA